MRMHPSPAARPPLRTSQDAGIASTALPLLLASAGMITIAVALILDQGVVVLAGAGLAVIGTATYLIIAGLDRADRRHAGQNPRAQGSSPDRTHKNDLPPRGPLADAAVDALTRSQGPGGVWPPLSSQKTPTRPQTVWDPHSQVGPDSFHDTGSPAQAPSRAGARADPAQTPPPGRTRKAHPGPSGEQEAMVEFAPVEPEPRPPTTPGNTRADDRHPGSGSPAGPTRHETPPQNSGDRDHRVWPGASDLGLWERWSGGREEERMSEARRATSMKERRERLAARLPTVGAILSSGEKEEAAPDPGATRGKCSSCQRYLWAPPQRPITLKCPGCGHKARLY